MGAALPSGGRRCIPYKTTKDAPTHDTPGALIRSEYMMGHKGLMSLNQNYFKTTVLELAAGYVNVVPDLTIDDADRLRLSNKRMADNIRKMEGEKDEKIARMEKELARMGAEMAELKKHRNPPGSDLVAVLRDAAGAEGVPGNVIKSLTGMMDQLVKSQKAALKEMQERHDAEIRELRRALDARGADP